MFLDIEKFVVSFNPLTYGILISVLWITRKDLFSCIIAHATTNLTLALYVYFTGHWQLW